jgi:hypothetical protein
MRPSVELRAVLIRLLAAAAGVIAVHQLAYLLAHPSTVGRAAAADGHGYLAPVAAVVVPVAAAVAVWAVVCRLAALSPLPPRATLARTGDYALLFVAQETLERVADGESALAALAEPAVWLGLALMPLLGLGGRFIGRSLERTPARPLNLIVTAPRLAGAPVPAVPDLPRRSRAPAARRVRGPPTLLR